MIVLGGLLPDGSLSSGIWAFDTVASNWKALQTEGLPSQAKNKLMPLPPNMAIVHDRLYTITGSSELHSSLHLLDLSKAPDALNWETIPFPTNGLTPGPRPRCGAGLVSISLGQGREYLIFFWGTKVATLETARYVCRDLSFLLVRSAFQDPSSEPYATRPMRFSLTLTLFCSFMML